MGSYETCYQCHIKEVEANDPIARKIRSIFNISQQDLEYKLMEFECVICDNWVGDFKCQKLGDIKNLQVNNYLIKSTTLWFKLLIAKKNSLIYPSIHALIIY